MPASKQLRPAALAAFGAGDLAFLGLCLSRPESAAEAFVAWRKTHDDPDTLSVSARLQDLQPLAARHLPTLAQIAPESFVTRMRTAALIEERRLAALRQLAAAIVKTPSVAAHAPVIVGGLALGETIYPSANLRHTSRLALVFPERAFLPQMAAALREQGFERRASSGKGVTARLRALLPRRVEMRHDTGMPLVLLRGRTSGAAPRLSYQDLREGARSLELTSGCLCLVPSVPHSFSAFLSAYGPTLLGAGAVGERSPIWLADLAFLRRALPDPLPTASGAEQTTSRFAALAEQLETLSGTRG